MTTLRRDFLKEALSLSALPALAPFGSAVSEALQQGGLQAVGADADAMDFWNTFLDYQTVPAKAAANLTRGGRAGIDREAFFFHYGTKGLQAAMDIPPDDLLPDGDVSIAVNVVAFRPAAEDRATFERLANASLRLDFVQAQPIIDVLDTLAWTAVAALNPDKTNKLPPIQNLSFDPGTSWTKMQNILMPGGQGFWAMNLYAQRKESLFMQVMQVLAKEVGRFSPILGLPGITTPALQSFNNLYGAFHSKPEYLFKTNPVPVFATAAAFESAGGVSRGLPLRSGTYVLVPQSHAEQLTPEKLDGHELRQGLLVPKDARSIELYTAASKTFPDVTYATVDVRVKKALLPAAGTGKKQADDAAPETDPAAPAKSGRGGAPAPPARPANPAPPAPTGRGRSR